MSPFKNLHTYVESICFSHAFLLFHIRLSQIMRGTIMSKKLTYFQTMGFNSWMGQIVSMVSLVILFNLVKVIWLLSWLGVLVFILYISFFIFNLTFFWEKKKYIYIYLLSFFLEINELLLTSWHVWTPLWFL